MIDKQETTLISMMDNCLIGKKSGGDFTTAYTSATTITCSDLPSYHDAIIDSDILSIVQINSVGKNVIHNRRSALITVAANVITITGANLLDTDTFLIYTNIGRVSTHSGSIDPITVVTDSDVGVSDGVWKNQGSLYKVEEPFIVNIWYDVTAYDSTDMELRVMCSATDGGTLHLRGRDDECILDLGSVSEARARPFTVGDLFPYIQIQTRAASLGATEGTITILINKGWVLEC